MRCPKCKNSILQKSNGETKIRTKGPMVFSKSGACTTKCFWCGEPVAVPLELRKAERFILKPPNG